MTATIDHARQGAANRRKGVTTEQKLAKWLRDNGWPHAERTVATGYRTRDRDRPDLGDITGTPGLVWQAKDVTKPQIETWLAETEQQRIAAAADYGLLVHRKRGVADVGKWWLYMTTATFTNVTIGIHTIGFPYSLVRVRLDEFVPYLHKAGYGTAPEKGIDQ